MEIEDFSLDQEQSHFEDIDGVEVCIDPQHNPPKNLYIPLGKRYIHICPLCGNRVVIQPPQIKY